MRAWICDSFGAPSVLRLGAVPATRPAAGQVRVTVDHAAVNYPDLLSIAGTYPIRSEPPFVPGIEGTGAVIECGPDVARLHVGDRVCWQDNLVKGSFAEEVTLAATGLARVPAGLSGEIAAIVPTVFGTAHFALVHRAGIRAGETLVVHGASGGVGLACVQLGKMFGAQVIATGADDAKLAIVKALGADHVINVGSEPVREKILDLTGGRGADIYFDPVGGDTVAQALRAIAPYGRILVIGFTSGVFPVAKANILLIKSASVIGANYGHYLQTETVKAREQIEALLDLAAQGKLQPRVHARFPFERCVEALEALAARQIVGKCVVTHQIG